MSTLKLPFKLPFKFGIPAMVARKHIYDVLVVCKQVLDCENDTYTATVRGEKHFCEVDFRFRIENILSSKKIEDSYYEITTIIDEKIQLIAKDTFIKQMLDVGWKFGNGIEEYRPDEVDFGIYYLHWHPGKKKLRRKEGKPHICISCYPYGFLRSFNIPFEVYYEYRGLE